MPTIEPRKDKNNKITGYRAKVRVKWYPPETATFKKKTDANEWGQRVESEMKQGKYFPHRSAKKNTVPVLIEKYMGCCWTP